MAGKNAAPDRTLASPPAKICRSRRRRAAGRAGHRRSWHAARALRGPWRRLAAGRCDPGFATWHRKSCKTCRAAGRPRLDGHGEPVALAGVASAARTRPGRSRARGRTPDRSPRTPGLHIVAPRLSARWAGRRCTRADHDRFLDTLASRDYAMYLTIHYDVEAVLVSRIRLAILPGCLECSICVLPSALAGELPAGASSRLPVVRISTPWNQAVASPAPMANVRSSSINLRTSSAMSSSASLASMSSS